MSRSENLRATKLEEASFYLEPPVPGKRRVLARFSWEDRSTGLFYAPRSYDVGGAIEGAEGLTLEALSEAAEAVAEGEIRVVPNGGDAVVLFRDGSAAQVEGRSGASFVVRPVELRVFAKDPGIAVRAAVLMDPRLAALGGEAFREAAGPLRRTVLAMAKRELTRPGRDEVVQLYAACGAFAEAFRGKRAGLAEIRPARRWKERVLLETDYEKLLPKAEAFMALAHEGQVDKSGRPYREHPETVASFVDGPKLKIAALLHDVVEDAGVDPKEIAEEFGPDVARIVSTLSRPRGMGYREYVERIAEDPDAATVKIADLRHNMDLSRLDGLPEAVVAAGRRRLSNRYLPAWRYLHGDRNAFGEADAS